MDIVTIDLAWEFDGEQQTYSRRIPADQIGALLLQLDEIADYAASQEK